MRGPDFLPSRCPHPIQIAAFPDVKEPDHQHPKERENIDQCHHGNLPRALMSDPFRSLEQLASDMWWNYSPLLAIIAAAGVILTAGYILWTIQRVYLGAEYRGPHPEALSEMNPREGAVALPFVAASASGSATKRPSFGSSSPSRSASPTR
mgnify:CR=1 FL=1